MDDRADREDRSGNRRPQRVTSLFYQGEPYDDWRLHNKTRTRFYLLNFERVLDLLDVQHTRMESHFRSAEEDIQSGDWAKQYPSEWTCSMTQLKPANRRKPRSFSRAVIMIVALEKYARAKRPDINVYDYLRIIPAFYFVDRFDKQKLAALEAHFASLDGAHRAEWLGPSAAKAPSFAQACLDSIEQNLGPYELLDQLAEGCTATKYVAERICSLVNADGLPAKLKIGPVRRVGEDSAIDQGRFPRKAAAGDLRVPKRRNPADLLDECGLLQ